MADVARRPEEDGRGRCWPPELDGWLRQVVAAHVPADPREEQARRQFLQALDSLDRPFDERTGPTHVTASAVVVGRRGTVLHLHKRLGRWMQPGGHVDPGESPWEAARREAEEETGLSLSHPADGPRLIHLDVHDAAKGHEHLDLRYLLLAEDRRPDPPPGESPEARWYSWDEALQVADDALVGALEVARRHCAADSSVTGDTVHP